MFRPGGWTLAALYLASALIAARAEWTWALDAGSYQSMPVRERAEYNRGRDLFNDRQYRAAAAVFERFVAQFPDSTVLPYIIFLRGYAFHQATDRNTAIKSYNEVLDYFGNVVEAAAPALYWLGVAGLENGDDRAGLSALKEMVEDEDYRQHELAAGALRRLADNHARNNEPREAVRYWQQVVDDFSERNRKEADEALNNLFRHALVSGEYAALMSWWVDPERVDDVSYRRSLAERLSRFAWEYFIHQQGKMIAEKEAWLKAFAGEKKWYEQDGDRWSYYATAMSFRSRHKMDDAELVDEMVAYVASL
ncbi:MAG: tetratricopeptide repeat protein, partial [Kiritimatiellia bacterium]